MKRKISKTIPNISTITNVPRMKVKDQCNTFPTGCNNRGWSWSMELCANITQVRTNCQPNWIMYQSKILLNDLWTDSYQQRVNVGFNIKAVVLLKCFVKKFSHNFLVTNQHSLYSHSECYECLFVFQFWHFHLLWSKKAVKVYSLYFQHQAVW